MNFPEDWEIDILVNSDRVKDYPYRGNIISMNMDKKDKVHNVLSQFGVLIKRTRTIKALKKTGRYMACISFMDSANVANILSGNKYCKCICSVRTSLSKAARLPQYKYVVNPLVKLLYNKADKVVAVSRGVRQELIDIFKIKENKVVAIENGYNIPEIVRQASEQPPQEFVDTIRGHKVVVTAGRLTLPKGHWHLIRAFSQVVKKIPEALLVIIGEGDHREYLESLIKAYHLEKNVILAGHTTNPFMYERYADVYAMPSIYEGFPNALAEAMCLGLPCVSTDFENGAREIMDPDSSMDKAKVKDKTRMPYGIMTPVCSGEKYSAEEPLEDAEQKLADALIDMLIDDNLNQQYRNKSNERKESLYIDKSIKEWIREIEA